MSPARRRRLAGQQQTVDLLDDVGALLGEIGMDDEEVIDMHGMVFGVPFARQRLIIFEEMPRPRILRQFIAENAGDHVAVEHQIFERFRPRRKAFDIGGVGRFGDMGIVAAEPGHLVEIDAIFVLQQSAHPHAGRL